TNARKRVASDGRRRQPRHRPNRQCPRRRHHLLPSHKRTRHTFADCRSFLRISEMNREGLMSSRSERYLAKAEKCQQVSDAADTSATKRLYEVLASQWRQLADEVDETDKKPLLEKIRRAQVLREIDKSEGAIQELVALRGITA